MNIPIEDMKDVMGCCTRMTAVSYPLDYIELVDGRRAQITVTLETDEDEFLSGPRATISEHEVIA